MSKMVVTLNDNEAWVLQAIHALGGDWPESPGYSFVTESVHEEAWPGAPMLSLREAVRVHQELQK
jgi:hypothetical protein